MDWRHYVRAHLPPLNVSAEREIEIVDELAGQLETTFERARANGATEEEAMRRARAEVPDWDALAQHTRPHRAAIRAHRWPRAPAPGDP